MHMNDELLPFNPILVWFYLILQVAACRDSWAAPFNPILVWFYLFARASDKTKAVSFQSHFGLILSRKCFRNMLWTRISFNPILVWFYLMNIREYNNEIRKAFNPILVWFYQSKKLKIPEKDVKIFQSHFGLILSTGNFPLFRYITFSYRSFTGLSSSTSICAVSI